MSGIVSKVVKVKNKSTAGTDTAATTSGYSAEITILDDTDLIVGMSTKAKIVISKRGNALAVPYDLVKYDDNGNAYILVPEAQEDGTYIAKRCDIEVGEEIDYYTEVTGGDLKAGDYFIYDYSVEEGDVIVCDLQFGLEEENTENIDDIMPETEEVQTSGTEAVEVIDGTEAVEEEETEEAAE